MDNVMGAQSLIFHNSPYIISSFSIVGKKEGQGPLKNQFDIVSKDDRFGQKTWEEAEAAMQTTACEKVLRKKKIHPKEIRYLFGGDLLRQGTATALGVEELRIPMFGLYGACSTSGEALALCAMSVAADYGDLMLAVTSSHFGSAEKEFRFPLGYASQRPLSSQWTVTGCGAFVVGHRKSNVRISAVTVGKIVDYGLRDPQNMGACMAPAAMDTILRNFSDLQCDERAYDQIITGDLGYVGSRILEDMMEKKGIHLRERHMDCGLLIYDRVRQKVNSGGSGCGCAATVLASYIIPMVVSGKWRRVLFVPTGALMSTVSFNEGNTVAGIAHGIVLEHC